MDEKRTKIGPTGPVRQTGASAVAAPTPTPAPAVPSAPGAPTGPVSASMSTQIEAPTPTPVPDGQPAGGASAGAQTSYLPPPPTDPLLGQTLAGRYLIGKKLGEGGMGAVYLATHNVLEKQVALKVLHGEFARKPDLVERFMQEAKAASRIRHENVIDISDFGSTPEGLVFFAMELLNGHDLHEDIARARLAGQLLPWSRSKRIFLQICGALSAAHRHGIVHRDLKPENVYLVEFLGDADFVKLLDFGIAKMTEVNEGDRKLTRTGMLFGTPEYMSPEQARGEPHVDHRVDIYAMGCILFQLVTGRVPFEAENFMGVLSLHLTEPPPSIPVEVFDRIGAPRELAAVIEQALAKDRAHRHQTIDDFANAVRAVCGEPPVMPAGTQQMAAQRAPSVPAPAETMQRHTPVAVPVAAPPQPTGRVRTQWTGTLSVPEVDAGQPAKPRSKLPLLIGAAVIVAGAAAAVVVAMSPGKPEPARPAEQGAPPIAQPATPPPTAPPQPGTPPPPPSAPPLAVLPDKVLVTLESTPKGAAVKDLMTGHSFGKTPVTFPLPPSRQPRQLSLGLRGYSDLLVEVVPDQPAIQRAETLVKLGSRPAGTRPVAGAGSAKPPEPGAGPGSAASAPPGPDPGAKRDPVPAIKPPPAPGGDDCPELPCGIKPDPSRGGGS